MKTTVEELIKERTYASLNSEELSAVSELCSGEEEFLNMKHFFREMEVITASGKTIINPEVKQSLDKIFSAKFPGINSNWSSAEQTNPVHTKIIPLYQRTWVRVAAVALLVVGTAPFLLWNNADLPGNKVQPLAKLEKPMMDEVSKPQTQAISETTVTKAKATVSAKTNPAVPASPALNKSESRSELVAASMESDEMHYEAYEKKAEEPVMMSAPSLSKMAAPAGPPSFAAAGRNADLFPNSAEKDAEAKPAVKVTSLAGNKGDELLDLLVPSF